MQVFRRSAADVLIAAFHANAVQFVNPSDVNQCVRVRQAQIHSREQAVSAGQRFRAVHFCEQLDRFRHRSRAMIIKLGRAH